MGVKVPQSDDINMDYMSYHAIVNHFDQTRGFGFIDGLKDQVWRWLNFCTDADKFAMGQVLLHKCVKFPQYLEAFKKHGKLDEIVLWVISKNIKEANSCSIKI